MAKRRELRITRPNEELYNKIIELAHKNNRSIPKQIEHMLQGYIDYTNKKIEKLGQIFNEL